MDFKEELKMITEKNEGVLSMAIVGYDGITVAEYHKSGKKNPMIEESVLESTRMLKTSSKTFSDHELGEAFETVITTEQLHIIFRALSKDYFVYSALNHHAIVGKIRFEIRRRANDFKKAL
ncbi:MAG: hypothetical protein KDD48_02575 [Bdellovibrionales bacterium]|nr:hypothetical protein [Bdellovibrionales bacterium]